jgi:uncharacterized protein (TIGR02118 family)
MIHQFIFANPKPGMSVEAFQDYWLNVHAVKYAAKIPQIVRYKIDTVLNFNDDKPVFSGIAEIWLKNATEQLQSLQSPEFLQGARLDEPNWVAFWETTGLDTLAHEFKVARASGGEGVKLVALIKRKEGLPLELFRYYSTGSHSGVALELPGLNGYMQCFTQDAAYNVGEPRFDAVYQLWFENLAALKTSLLSDNFQTILEDLNKFIEMKYFFKLICKEHWIIGPEYRA